MAKPKKILSQPGTDLIRRELKELERILREQSRSEVRLLMEVADHILESGGKRFRPAVLLLSAKLCGYSGPRAVAYAAAVEYAHTSTLLHDDVVDEALTRRGRPSANGIWGNQASVLVGDYLLFRAFYLLIENEDPRIMKLVNSVATQMAEGEAFQLTRKGNAALSEAEYFRIITDKTAKLISLSCQIGAILGRATAKHEHALGEYGFHLGLAFQLKDDVLDYAGDERDWGKKVGQDFSEGKMTLPLIWAFQNSSAADRKKLARLLAKPKRKAGDFKTALAFILRHGGLDYALAKACSHAARAKSQLQIFPDSPPKQALLDLADFVVARSV
jgi:octaprenyl-diphosphate synthase